MKKCRAIACTAILSAVILWTSLYSVPAYADTQSAEDGYVLADDIVQKSTGGSSYILSDGTTVDIDWVKIDPGKVGFASKDMASGEQTMIMPRGYEMTYWFVIDNGFREIKTEAQKVESLYIEYENERAISPGEQFLYKKNPNSTANTVCYDMPQGFDFAGLGNWVISVKRVIKITDTESGAKYEDAEPEVYLSSNGGKASIIEGLPRVYRVKMGDSLWNIAERLYGIPEKWTALFRQNQSAIRNPDRIYTGQMIVLPTE